MNRKIHWSILTVLLFLALSLAFHAEQASAQVPNTCCTFRIIVSNLVPNACMPVSVTTDWGSARQTDVVTVKGTGNPPLPIGNCPPPPPLNGVSLDGGVTVFVGLGTSGPITLLPCGFCVKINVSYSVVDGCIEIRVMPC